MFIGKPFDGESMADLRRGMDRKRSTMLLWKSNNISPEMVALDGGWKSFEPNRLWEEDRLSDVESNPADSVSLATRNPGVTKISREAIAKWNSTLPKTYS
jgi:hypothetical protein